MKLISETLDRDVAIERLAAMPHHWQRVYVLSLCMVIDTVLAIWNRIAPAVAASWILFVLWALLFVVWK